MPCPPPPPTPSTPTMGTWTTLGGLWARHRCNFNPRSGGVPGTSRFWGSPRSWPLSILTSLSDALELRFPFLSGHANRVRDLSMRIGERMGLAKADLSTLRHAAELHDVGIVGIPGNLLAKKRRLNEQETEMVRGGAGTLFDPEVAELFTAAASAN